MAAKRDGKALSPEDVRAFVEGYTAGEISDALASAFLMAWLLRGLDDDETLALTKAMVDSGDTLRFSGGETGDGSQRALGPTVDKHSTGGVADGVTLVFAPLAAALGLAVAKLSGRGLGHTGGTLDKLESIPGLRTDLSPEEIRRQVEEVGCAVAAQSPNLVPADGALYALRDATATVPSIPLIAASVMSKKLAVETDLILLDVKAGSGRVHEDPGGRARAGGGPASRSPRVGAAAAASRSPTCPSRSVTRSATRSTSSRRSTCSGGARRAAAGDGACCSRRGRWSARTGSVTRRRSRRPPPRSRSGGRSSGSGAMVEAQGGDPRVVDDPVRRAPGRAGP